METENQNPQRTNGLFEELGGEISDGFPTIHAPTHHTPAGTPYLKSPGVAMISKPQTNIRALAGFLEGFDPSLRFPEYLDDPTELPSSSQLCKTAGQNCYASFGPRRTTNENAAAYFERLTSAGHGCYDGETEVLTADGWKFWAEVGEDDEFATLNERREIEYHHPLRLVHYRHEGRMYRVESSGVDLLVTPEHRMYVCPTSTRAGRKRNDYRLTSCEELDGKAHAYLKSGGWYDVKGGHPAVYALLG
ncbi:MAG: Hint domain-containing protein, partial [Rubrobacteraceae bacterium]